MLGNDEGSSVKTGLYLVDSMGTGSGVGGCPKQHDAFAYCIQCFFSCCIYFYFFHFFCHMPTFNTHLVLFFFFLFLLELKDLFRRARSSGSLKTWLYGVVTVDFYKFKNISVVEMLFCSHIQRSVV